MSEDGFAQYADIIDLPHHVSQRHPQMPLADRAAQFSPFAALEGYDKHIQDTQEKHRPEEDSVERE